MPGGSLIAAGVDAAGRGGEPCIAGEIEGEDAAIHLAKLILDVLFDVNAGALDGLCGGFDEGVGDGAARLPGFGVGREGEDAAVGAGEEGSVRGLREYEDIAAVESVGNLLPGGSAIGGNKCAAVGFVIHDTGIKTMGIGVVDEEGFDLALGEAGVGRGEGLCAIGAGEDAAAIGGKEDVVRVSRIHIDIVDDDVGTGHELEVAACVGGAVEALGGAGVDGGGLLRVLTEDACAARGGGNALNPAEELARGLALVDTAAGAGVDGVRFGGVDEDGEDVGVVDDALLDVVPGLAAVGGLPGQVPGAGVDGIGIGGVDGERLNLVNLLAAGRADLIPGDACIGAAKDSLQRACEEEIGILGGDGEGADGLAVEGGNFAPGAAAVEAGPEAAIGMVDDPGGGVDAGGVARIHDDVIDDEIVGCGEAREAMPGRTAVRGLVDPGVDRAEIEVLRLAGNRGKGAGVAAIGTDRGPGGLRAQGGGREGEKNQPPECAKVA